MKKTKLPSLVTVLILTLITVVMWAGFDVYRLIKSGPSPSVPANISQPLTPSLDQDSINQIESRIYLNDSQIPDNVVSSNPSATTPVSSPIPNSVNATGSAGAK